MMKATSPAAKSSPMMREAIKAMDTSTSALMSKAVTRPMTASKMMGIPQRTTAAQAASKGQLRQQVEDADKQGDAGEDQVGHGLLHAAPTPEIAPEYGSNGSHPLFIPMGVYVYYTHRGMPVKKSAAVFRQNTLRHTDSSCKMTTKQEGENRNATAALPDRRPAHSGPPVR